MIDFGIQQIINIQRESLVSQRIFTDIYSFKLLISVGRNIRWGSDLAYGNFTLDLIV